MLRQRVARVRISTNTRGQIPKHQNKLNTEKEVDASRFSSCATHSWHLGMGVVCFVGPSERSSHTVKDVHTCPTPVPLSLYSFGLSHIFGGLLRFR